MVQPDDIRPLRASASDYEETERIKRELLELKNCRTPFFLTKSDLDQIFRWKLDGQLGRDKRHLERNVERAYEIVTKAAFAITDDDWKLEAELRLSVLSTLHGVGVPVASAILALADPERYCVIDFRGWRAVFGEDRTTFDIPSYLQYLPRIKELAKDLNWSVQETDLAVWEYDRRKNGKGETSSPKL